MVKNAAGHATARLTDNGYWLLAGDVHAEQGTLTLDPAKKYWNFKNSASAPVFAIDIETGDVWSSGTLSQWETNIDTTGAFFPFSASSGETVFVVYTTGASALMGGFSPHWLSADPPDPMPTDPGATTTSIQAVIDRIKALDPPIEAG